MKRSISKKNKQKRIIVLFVIFIIILLILLIILRSLKNRQAINQPAVVNTDGWMGYKNTLSDIYKGNKDTLVINTKIKQVFETYIPVLIQEFKDLNTDQELIEYYEENKNYIQDHLLIYSRSEFLKLVNSIRIQNIDVNVLGYIVYKNNSYEKEEDLEKFCFTAYYTEKKCITFEVEVYDLDNIIKLNVKQ